jgi:integrase
MNMSKVNYYLKGAPSIAKLAELKAKNLKEYNKQIDILRPIILSVSINGNRDILSTGKFISLKNWHKPSQSIKLSVDLSQVSREDKFWLESKKLQIERFIIHRNSEQLIVRKEDVYKLLDRLIIKEKKECTTWQEILELFLLEHKTKNGHPLKPNTKKKYNTLIKMHLFGFLHGEISFYPIEYTNDWIEEFRQYLLDEGCNDNTLCKYIEALKTLFKFLMDKGWVLNVDLSKIKTFEYEQEINILTFDEIKQFGSWIFSNISHEKVRDIFLFQCYTGARYSDIEKMTYAEVVTINGKKCWSYIPKKTNDQPIITPINENALNILMKYSELGTPLPRLSNKTMNETLKVVAEITGLERVVKKISFSRGTITETYCPLHRIISTHMARKTFISLSLQMGIPEQFVKAVSGHKDDKSFRRYVNLANEHLNPVLQAWDSACV